MKNKFILSLLAVIILSSCAQKFSLVKRKYSKGFYVSVIGNKGAASVPLKKEVVLHKKEQAVSVLTQIVPKSTDAVPATDTKVAQATAKEKRGSASVNISSTTYAGAKTHAGNINFNSRKIKALPPIITKPKGKAEVDEIIMILLCLFLPPLAVYLFDNSLSTNFWVDLLLCLLFWLPGIIFAFLVCFAGVSL